MLALAFVFFTAAAQPNDPVAQAQIERGKAAVAELEYGIAAEEFMAVATSPNASDAQKREANLHAGIVHRILGNNVEAKLHFMYVLTRAPDTALPPGQPPKVSGFYALVRDEAIQLRQIQAAATAPPRVNAPMPEANASPKSTTPPAGELDPETQPSNSVSPMLIAGLISAGVGGAVLVGAVTSGLITDVVFASPDVDTDIRESARVASFFIWIPGLAGVIALAVGGGIAMGGLE